jgi:hypothetical protein
MYVFCVRGALRPVVYAWESFHPLLCYWLGGASGLSLCIVFEEDVYDFLTFYSFATVLLIFIFNAAFTEEYTSVSPF